MSTMKQLSADHANRLKKQFYLQFTKLNGLSLPVEALTYMLEVFANVPDDAGVIQQSLGYIIEAYQQQDVSSVLVDLEVLKRVVVGLMRTTDDSKDDKLAEARRYIQVIDAFSVPRLKYDAERKNFFKHRDEPKLFASPAAKIDYIRSRYDLIKQRLYRNANFTTNTGGGGDRLKITPIQSLVGVSGECLIFGMLSQLKEGRYFIEEPEANIELDFSHAVDMMEGLYTEFCFVIVEGSYADSIFKVTNMAMPPAESAELTHSIFGHINFWGGAQMETEGELANVEMEAQDGAVAVLSDVWLDKPKVMQALRLLFKGFSENPPLAFVFMGSFLSMPFVYNGADSIRYKECFDELADLIADFPTLARLSQFVFVPSLTDPGMSTVLPRPGIPAVYTQRMREKVPTAVFASNPCRIRFCTKEVMFFRDDMVGKMRRNCIRAPSAESSKQIPDLLAKTLFDQAHLSPLPLSVRPVYWAYDHALSLYPLPNALFLGDQHEMFTKKHVDSMYINPGPFATSDFWFMFYFPFTDQVEQSNISLSEDY